MINSKLYTVFERSSLATVTSLSVTCLSISVPSILTAIVVSALSVVSAFAVNSISCARIGTFTVYEIVFCSNSGSSYHLLLQGLSRMLYSVELPLVHMLSFLFRQVMSKLL